MAQEEIKLVGIFRDEITPGLKKVNKSIDQMTRSFARLGKQLSKTNTQMSKFATTANKKLGINTTAVNKSTAAWTRHTKAVRSANAAARSYRPAAPMAAPMAAPKARSVRPAAPMAAPKGRGRGGEGGGGRGGAGGLSFMGAAAAGFTGNMATLGVYAAVTGLQSAVNGFVQQGKQAQTDFLMMANTLSTLGGVDFDTAKALSETTIADLVKTAQVLPGSTKQFIQIAQQVMDESIVGFGSMEAALADISKGADSFVGRFGLLAQAAGLDTTVAAGDIAQLAANPKANPRQISLFKYNPALFKAYTENLAKFNGDYFKALNAAMKEVTSPALISELRNTFSTSIEEFSTALFDPFEGIFGAMRKVTVSFADGSTAIVTTMDTIGIVMRQVNDLVGTLLGASLSTDPLVALNNFLNEVGYAVFKLNQDFKHVMAETISLGEMLSNFGGSIGDFLGMAGANLINFITGIDYSALAQGLNTAIFDFFTTLFANIDYGQIGQMAMNLVKGMFSSITGFIIGAVVIAKFVAAVQAAMVAFAAFKASMMGFGIVMKVAASGLMTALLPLLPIIAAIAGAVMIVIAIVRNWGNIVKLVGAGFKLWFSSFKLQWATIFTFLLKGIRTMLGPLGGFLDKPIKDLNQVAADAKVGMGEAYSDMKEATSGIAQQTVNDFKAIGDGAKGLIPGREAETRAVVATTKQMQSLTKAARDASSTFENNIKVVDEAGTAWGWAIQHGKEVMVEWGSVAGTATVAVDDLAAAANPAATALANFGIEADLAAKALATVPDTFSQGAKDAINAGLASPNTPEGMAAGMDWYNKVMPPEVQNNISATNRHTEAIKTNTADTVKAITQSTSVVSAIDTARSSIVSKLDGLYSGIQRVQIVGTPTVIAQIAGGGNKNHVGGGEKNHVAYANGPSQPAFFSSQAGAMAWENKMAPNNAAVASVTSNSSEFGKSVSVNVQSPVFNIVAGDRDGAAIAEEVASALMTAIRESSYDEIFQS